MLRSLFHISLLLFLMSQTAFAIEVQGHRGARTVLPENSLPGFEYALDIGVDTLEMDTGVTKDGVVVVIHDQKINTTICQYKDGREVEENLWVHQLTLEQIKQFDCGSRINPRFKAQKLIPGTNIPTLREVFELIKNSSSTNAETVLFNIETKSDADKPHAQPEPEAFAQAIIDLVKEFGLTERVSIQSFDHRTLLATKAINPKIQTVALYEEDLSDWVTPTLKAKAGIVSPYFKNLSKQEIKDIHAAGLKVTPWTANKAEDWKKLIEMGVDGIITDDPKPLLEILGR